MHPTTTLRIFLFGLAILAAGPKAWAQAGSADAIARKAYSARHDRAYVLFGGAAPDYRELNKFLEKSEKGFPKLKPGALMFGAGYGQGAGSLGVVLEWRLTVRANDVDSSFAYSNLLTNTFSLVGRYNVLVTNRYTAAVMLGPTYSRLNLTMKEAQPNNLVPSSFIAQLNAGGDKRKLYQSQLGATVGIQVDRHFAWLRRNDVQACGRARQVIVGLRLQFDYDVKHYRWHTENPLFRPNTKVEREPKVGPVGFSAALVFGGLLNRY